MWDKGPTLIQILTCIASIISVTHSEVIDLRLPKAVTPESYLLRIISFLDEAHNFTFNGEVKILINVRKPTSNITLHSKELDIDRNAITLKTSDEKNIVEIDKTEYEVEKDFFIVYFKQELELNQKYYLHITYKGKIHKGVRGFYRFSYEEDDKTKWIGVTHFEPTYARMAFPSFDEPSFKAKFTISIGRAENLSSVSNMPRKDISESVSGVPGHVWDHYEESPPMSSYLVCFAVSDYGKITNGNFTVWARKSVLSQAEYALKIGPEILKFYEQYFLTPFPIPKMDMIGLREFEAGAMENWGLITYIEESFLYNNGVTTDVYLKNIGLTVSHELAHQWFGNLVTMSWWSNLWLNEGFATYVSYLGIDKVEPEWNMLKDFITSEIYAALIHDTGTTSHKICADVMNPEEIGSIFDAISYAKGGSVIRMMEHFLTIQVLQKGLMLYLNIKKYNNADQDDLWAALTTQAQEDGTLGQNVTVKQIMDTWTLQEGHPIITVTRNYDAKTATFTQNHFKIDSAESPSLWYIPITYTSSDNPDFNNTSPKFWMPETRSETIKLNAGENDWLIVNLKEVGFFRVNYDPHNWDLLITHLKDPNRFREIDVISRMHILFNAFSLAEAGILNYAVPLEVSKYLAHEDRVHPWIVANSGLKLIQRLLSRSRYYSNMYEEHLLKIGYYRSTSEYIYPYRGYNRIGKRANKLLLDIKKWLSANYREDNQI